MADAIEKLVETLNRTMSINITAKAAAEARVDAADSLGAARMTQDREFNAKALTDFDAHEKSAQAKEKFIRTVVKEQFPKESKETREAVTKAIITAPYKEVDPKKSVPKDEVTGLPADQKLRPSEKALLEYEKTAHLAKNSGVKLDASTTGALLAENLGTGAQIPTINNTQLAASTGHAKA